jgi:hypothetical protein
MRVDSNKTGRNVKGSNCVLPSSAFPERFICFALYRRIISSTLLLLSLWMLIVWWTLLDQS